MSYREQRMNIYKEIIDNNYNYSKKLELELNKKDAELAALRGFSEEVLDNLHRPCRLYLTELAQKWKLFDEHVQPTKLLTGEE